MASALPTLPIHQRSAAPFWPASLFLWLLAFLLIGNHIYMNVLSLRGLTLTDFHIYHEALGHAAHGKVVYDLTSPMPFLYPPFFLIILWPLGWLSEPSAMTAWLYLQNVFLVVSLAALLAAFRPLDHRLAAWLVVMFAGFSPVTLNNLYGQTNLLCLAILSLFVLFYFRLDEKSPPSRACDIAAALALSAAISIRVLPLALLAMAAIQRRYRLAAWTVLFVAAEALAAGWLVGFRAELDYFTTYIFRLRGLENMREISLWALMGQMVGRPLDTILFGACVAAALGVFAALVYRPMRQCRPSPALHLAFVITSMVLFAPLLEYHHYVTLLAAYALVLGDLRHRAKWQMATALPVFFSWAVVSAANQLSHYRFGAVAFAGLAGTALLWGFLVQQIVASPPPLPPPKAAS